MVQPITFGRRARKRTTEVATLIRYSAIDGRPFSVVYAKSSLGLRPRWLAVKRLRDGGEYIISYHRSRDAAAKACDIELRRMHE